MAFPFFAHTGAMEDCSDWQPLRDHLANVARLAMSRMHSAVPFLPALSSIAEAAGCLHDLGKYRDDFQRLLLGLSVQRERTWHKQAGAAKAIASRNVPVAFAIAGHHGGLPDRAQLKEATSGPSGTPVANSVWATAVDDCPALAHVDLASPPELDLLTIELLTRLTFSCLVDADWSDTSEHSRIVERRPEEVPAPSFDAPLWLARVLQFIENRSRDCRQGAVAESRAAVLSAALQAAELAPGMFSLTVPTGGGKTLSGLAFALKHAMLHGLRRVIYVAPYLSILDQNAEVIRNALGMNNRSPEVFEHHSLAEPMDSSGQPQSPALAFDSDNETRTSAAVRRAENWDSPIIVTTSVQFFESLFANKPGQCRKLHNIARSVVLLDECQTLPLGLVAPTCFMLGQLVQHWGCSMVLCTATQPAFQHSDMPGRLTNVREIAPPELRLFERLRRVRVEWPYLADLPVSWSEVAARMVSRPAALCVVNTRRAARELYAELQQLDEKPAFHLSTSMCPAHRLEVLAEVKRRLRSGKDCYLVATQLIEAGVDVDFPLVLRELAPLEAVIQAAGRCNREGLLNGPAGEPGGQVVVFRSLDGALPRDGWYETGRDLLTTSFLQQNLPPDIGDPADIQRYFRMLYSTKGMNALDRHDIQSARSKLNFEEVAKAYRIIGDDSIAVVVANWANHQTEIETLLEEAQRNPSRANYRRLAPFQVNLRRPELAKLPIAAHEEVPGLLVWRGIYDSSLGFSPAVADDALVV